MTNHAVQNIHFQLVLVGHKNVILGFDVTTVPTSTNGAVAIIQPLCWYWLVHKSDRTNQYQRCGCNNPSSLFVLVGHKFDSTNQYQRCGCPKKATARLVMVGQYTPFQPCGKSDWSYGYMLDGHGWRCGITSTRTVYYRRNA